MKNPASGAIHLAIVMLATVALVGPAAATPGRAGEAPRDATAGPRLILQITVDQLRGDLPDRFRKNMGEGGFRYLMENGVWFANAHYGHANTETVVGHTTLATGADPSTHGMVSNVWFDQETGVLAYNIEDARHHLLSVGGDVDKETEVDATQKVATTDGRSPANILVSTFSDELALHTNGKARIFGVSVKDRGAVTLAGHAGKAFWFSKSSGEFVTSSYYYEQYPGWADAWNERRPPHAYAGTSWELLHDTAAYVFGDADEQPWETDAAGFGTTFPHAYGSAESPYFNHYLSFSPAGDELTLDFAKALIDAENLGQDEVTDFLAVSFSSTDYVGHIFGPSSLEAEDNMLRLDRSLAALFAHVDERVGLQNTLIVLSADHGGPEAPGHLNELGIEARYVSPREWDKAPSIEALKRRFGIGQELIQSFFPPYLYLDRAVIREKGLDQGEVEQAVAGELMKMEGVALAVSSTAMRENRLPDAPLIRAALRGYNPRRSGDILLIFQPHHFINEFDGEVVTCSHGSPWRYDTFVPIVFAGGHSSARRVHRRVEPVDIAPTLAAILGVKPPSGSRGTPMPEVVEMWTR